MNRRTCHGGAGKATGWVLPVTVALNTEQLVIIDKDLVGAFSEICSSIFDCFFHLKFHNSFMNNIFKSNKNFFAFNYITYIG